MRKLDKMNQLLATRHDLPAHRRRVSDGMGNIDWLRKTLGSPKVAAPSEELEALLKLSPKQLMEPV